MRHLSNVQSTEPYSNPSSEDISKDEFRLQFAARLGALLDARGYPNKNYGRNTKLAEDLDIIPTLSHKILNGQLPKPDLLRRLCEVLNTTTDYLYGMTDIPDRTKATEMPSAREQQALITRFWKPDGTCMREIDLPLPTFFSASSQLKGFWARRPDEGDKGLLEFVAYDSSDTNLRDGHHYLMDIDGIPQIRQVEMLDKPMCRIWFHNQQFPMALNMETMRLQNKELCKILGKIVFRTTVR
jgi:hypothetical protein